MKELEQIKDIIFNKQIENIKNDIISATPNKIDNFIVYSEKTKDYNIFLVYGVKNESVFSHIYRMVIIDNYFEKGHAIFTNGNVICSESYTLDTVKEWAKNSLNNAIKQL